MSEPWVCVGDSGCACPRRLEQEREENRRLLSESSRAAETEGPVTVRMWDGRVGPGGDIVYRGPVLGIPSPGETLRVDGWPHVVVEREFIVVRGLEPALTLYVTPARRQPR